MKPINEGEQRVKSKIRLPRQYKVVMFNDDYTTMEFVTNVLMSIFSKSEVEAQKIMLDVHKKGQGIAGIYSYDMAMSKAGTAMSMAKSEGFPFKLSVEEV